MTAAVDVCLLSGNDKNLVTSNLSRMREFEGAGPKFSMPCALCCYFSHLRYSLAYDYFTIDDVVKANEMNALIVIFLPLC